MRRTGGGQPAWPVVLAWALWLLTMLILVAIPWLDRLLRQAGRPDLEQWDVSPGVAAVSAATVGAVLAARRPRHPVGWLLLAQVVTLLATGAAAQYLAWGLLNPAGSLPATRLVALGYPATAGGGLIVLGFVLLLTPTGRLPSPRWRWGARVMVAVPAVLLVAVLLAPGPVDPPSRCSPGRSTSAGWAAWCWSSTVWPGVHDPGGGGLCRVAGGALSPRLGGGAPAAALGGLRGRAGGAGGDGRPGRYGAGFLRGAHLGDHRLAGGAPAGHRRRRPALPAL